jgi:hypothetical protein
LSRDRIDEIVEDPVTAENLKPWYNMGCKRPCFHDEFLPTFNRDNVTLVHTDGKGIKQITEKGVVFEGEEYELDVLVYATGFGACHVALRNIAAAAFCFLEQNCTCLPIEMCYQAPSQAKDQGLKNTCFYSCVGRRHAETSSTFTSRTGFEFDGEGGRQLGAEWNESGMRTLWVRTTARNLVTRTHPSSHVRF